MSRTLDTELRVSAVWGAMAKNWPRSPGPDALDDLRRIGESGETWAAASLLALALAPDDRLAATAAEAIHRLLAHLSPIEWTATDTVLRTAAAGWWLIPGMPRPVPETIVHYPIGKTEARSVLACAACARDGHLREAAVRRLAEIRNGSELPLLLLRGNDWVAPIRRLAEPCLRERIVPGYASHWVDCLELIQRARTWERNDALCGIIAGVDALLMREECRPALEAGTRCPNRTIRRECFRLGIATPEGFHRLARAALLCGDPLVRLRTVRQAREVAPTEMLCDLLYATMFDPVSRVRVEALSLLADRCPEAIQRELFEALFAEPGSVRELAWSRCRESRAEIADLYREVIRREESRRLTGAIAGLGELGHVDDGELLLPHTVAGRSKVRRAAIRALYRLTGEAYRGLCLDLLADPEPGVSREATSVLERCASRLRSEQLWETWEAARKPHVRRNLLRLWREQPPWVSGPWLLRALAEVDEDMLPAVDHAIGYWECRLYRTGYQPTAAQKGAISQAIDACGPRLPDARRETLLFRLR